MPPDRVIVVSIHKSGTNLLTRLFRAVGFRVVGAGVRDSYPAIFAAAARRQKEAGAPGRGSRTILSESEVLLDLCVAEASGPTCIVLHGARAPADQRGPAVDRGWPIVFNYRDPRAVLTSFVHYLTGGSRERFTDVDGFEQLSQVLMRLPTVEDRISFVLRHMPDYLRHSFSGNAWLLTYPGVITVSYEALVGRRGGGSDEVQHAAVARLLSGIRVTADVQLVASSLYSSAERTFRSGTVDDWRNDFSPELLDYFNATYGELLATYGYTAHDCTDADASSVR